MISGIIVSAKETKRIHPVKHILLHLEKFSTLEGGSRFSLWMGPTLLLRRRDDDGKGANEPQFLAEKGRITRIRATSVSIGPAIKSKGRGRGRDGV